MKMVQNNMRPLEPSFEGSLIRRLCFLSFLFLSTNCFSLSDGNFTYNSISGGVEVSGCSTACPEELIIPDAVAGQSVIEIRRDAFYDEQLTSVVLPSNLEKIGANAFGRNQLTSVTLPDTVIWIGGNAFSSNQLSNIEIPSGTERVEAGAFSSNQISSLTIPESLYYIGANAFRNNELVSIQLPNGV